MRRCDRMVARLHGLVGAAVAALGLAGGCTTEMPDYDSIYADARDHFVFCADSIDDKYAVSPHAMHAALTRADHHNQTLHVYAHDPGVTVDVTTIHHLLAGANKHGVPFVTYDQLANGWQGSAVALSFDDHSVADWQALQPLLAYHHAHATFFVSAFAALSDDERAALRQLADDGHDIEFHSVSHANAVDYVAEHGVQAYLDDEILPGLDAMHAAGYAANVFAYPYGARSDVIDAALAPYFLRLRALRTTCPQ